MDKIEELLPRISEYLKKDLAREGLSPVAEATRRFYVERIRALEECKEDSKNLNSNFHVDQVNNLFRKKLGGEIAEKKNGYSRHLSCNDVIDRESKFLNRQINVGASTNSLGNTDNGDFYDSEFDTSDDESANTLPAVSTTPERTENEELFSRADFKGEFFQNIFLKMRKRTCYVVGSELICASKSKIRSRFSVLNCKTQVKQHEGKFPVEVRLEPVVYSLTSLYTTDSQLAWRLVKALKDAGGAIKDDKRVTNKEADAQSSSTHSSENQNLETEKYDLLADNLKAKMQNFFGTIGKKKGRQITKIPTDNDLSSGSEILVSGYVKLLNKALSNRWHRMFCYISGGVFYAKKEQTDDHVEMAIQLHGATVGLPSEDSTKDFKIKIDQKDTKFIIELSRMFEHSTWIQILMVATQQKQTTDKPVAIFGVGGESNVDSSSQNSDSIPEESPYANHSEIMALMNSTANLQGDRVSTPIREEQQNHAPISNHILSHAPLHTDQSASPIRSEDGRAKQPPPIALKPNCAKLKKKKVPTATLR